LAGKPSIIEVAAGLVFRDQKLLITQRMPDDHLAGLWEFPGGKREAGESFEACLVRELREELRIEVGVGKLLESVIHEYPERLISIQFYRCTWLEGEPVAVGCQDFRWVNEEELDRYQFPAADAGLVGRLKRCWTVWVADSGHE